MSIENAIVVINKTRLEQLTERFNTKAQAKFYIEHSGGDFRDYEVEHSIFHESLEVLTKSIHKYLKLKVLERKFMPNFIFSEKDAVVVLGQDGLVANTAKYVGELPILAVNPDINRYDGILLPFNVDSFERGLIDLLENKAKSKRVTMAEAKTNDGQRLLAFNDLFIGPSSHISARYKITHGQMSENQSSSGLLVSTGAGSTGWLSSVINMANGVQTVFNSQNKNINLRLKWDENKLVFVVREPFKSKYSQVSISAGLINQNEKLIIESYMPAHGIIFSDGIEADFLHFNSGTSVEISVAQQKANIIQ
jgi:NAD kinase